VGKTIAVILALAMLAQIIKPFGLPGLRRRSDAWKIALFALAIMVLVVGLRPN
jgi:ABC-type branched-subunit amino acid transport system permease subunit